LPPTEAILRVLIDDTESTGPIFLPEGLDPSRERTPIRAVNAAAQASAAA